MSTEFESLVRPFQTNEVTPSRTYFMPGEIGVPNVILRLGRGGGGKTLTGSFNYTQTFYCEQFHVQAEGEAERE